MSQSMKIHKQSVDIDLLLANTWLQVISLRQGMTCPDGEGEAFWKRCVEDIEHVQKVLKDADVSEQNCQHIMYAQCAVLDETVKGRKVQDDAYYVWCNVPLQTHFFNTLDAGSQLYEQIRAVLREPAPDICVLTCFHRVLMLAFLGGYSSLTDTRREQLVEQLSLLVPAFSFTPSRPVLAISSSGNRLGAWLRYWPVRLGLAGLVVALLWCGLDHWLSGLLTTLLPGSV
ncbi:type VI secretion system protein TssL, short form [Rahnella victoriana]|uniref:type VI secretion system protein TssL, short form n=1 Tax=Rahnella victoriana TaxID=1510570 RepID=UPI001E398CF3|nr:type VI secretion system protein TssL, short form [Rahnella victoriana]UHM93425.1 type VI secretion system protein TssL, short form [Rahnella victoriana]